MATSIGHFAKGIGRKRMGRWSSCCVFPPKDKSKGGLVPVIAQLEMNASSHFSQKPGSLFLIPKYAPSALATNEALTAPGV